MAKQKRQFKKIVNWECQEQTKQFIVAEITILFMATILLIKYRISAVLFTLTIILPYIFAWISSYKRKVIYEEI